MSGEITGQDIIDHVKASGDGRLTSFSTRKSGSGQNQEADKFGSNLYKVSTEDLANSGKPRIIIAEEARVITANDTNKKVRREANNVYQNMKRNNELLVHGEVTENQISKCR